MNYWWVNNGQTFKKEIEGGCLWVWYALMEKVSDLLFLRIVEPIAKAWKKAITNAVAPSKKESTYLVYYQKDFLKKY